MKWVVLAIVLGLATYTYFTLKFRKEGVPHQPVEDAKERFTLSRLREAGYRRVTITADLPGDPTLTLAALSRPFAETKPAPAGLPEELADTFAEKPRLPASFKNVSAPAAHTAMLPYSLQYVCQLPDNQKVFGETRVYVKNNHIAIITDFDRLDDDLLTRTQETTVRLQIPAGIFRSGETFDLTLVGENASQQWSLQVH